MKKLFTTSLITVALGAAVMAQGPENLDAQVTELETSSLLNAEVVMPPSPLTITELFIGGIDRVQIGNGETALAKENHDFIGVTPDTENPGQFWISINHEETSANDLIGDGGGMTVFKAEEDENGNITLLDQTLPDGRTGRFFNVDFQNTVGITVRNCGGLTSNADGRIWTAEEADFVSNGFLFDAFGDSSDFTIQGTGIEGNFDGATIAAADNIAWMVEIDPRTATTVRKQYNWGRQSFEHGAIPASDTVVYLGVDATPAVFLRFITETPGNYNSGQLQVYRQSAAPGNRWIDLNDEDIEAMLSIDDDAPALGVTGFNRIEWLTIDEATGRVYLTETGRDNPGNRWADEVSEGLELAQHHIERASDQGVGVTSGDYADFYGRILVYDPATEEMDVFLEAGAGDDQFDNQPSVSAGNYPTVHLSNPDGLNVITIGEQPYLIICEDLNGTSMNRMPFGIANRTCELFLLDLSIESPTVDDLIRIAAVPYGAEVTGAIATPSGKTILVNSQHPNSSESVNNFPYNHSITIAITGFEGIITSVAAVAEEENGFSVYPNPVTRELRVEEITDLILTDLEGTRVRVARNTNSINVEGLAAGVYILTTAEEETAKVTIQE